MIVGIPKEIKNHEYRVGGTPEMVQMLVQAGHQVLVQMNAGTKIGYTDEMYEQSGAKIVPTIEKVYEAEMIVKVKEPQSLEFPLMKEGQILFCFLHLAPDPEQLKHLIERKVVGIAFETVTDDQGKLPILTPMSEVAGRFAIQAGAHALQLTNGGRGVLLGGVPGVAPAKVVVIGGGASGTLAARVAMGCGSEVTIIERRPIRLKELDDLYGPRLKTLFSTPTAVEESITCADLVVGAVLIPGKKAPKVISEAMIKKMNPGSVFVDVSIDQGGCSETSRPTTHSEPTYVVHGVIHNCVTNMPGACARTSTQALTNVLIPFVMNLAGRGYKKAMLSDRHLLNGLNVYKGKVTNQAVAEDCGYEFFEPAGVLS